MQKSLAEFAERTPDPGPCHNSVIDNEPSEAARLERRRQIRASIAEHDFVQSKMKPLRKRLQQIEQEQDALVDQHRDDCKPIRAELASVDETILASMTAQEPIPDGLEEKREKLLRQIEDLTSTFDDALASLKRRRKPIAAEIQALQKELNAKQIASRVALENSLTLPGTGNPELVARHWAANRLATMLFDMLGQLQRRRDELAGGHSRVRNAGEYADKFDILLDMAGKHHADADRAATELRQQLLAE